MEQVPMTPDAFTGTAYGLLLLALLFALRMFLDWKGRADQKRNGTSGLSATDRSLLTKIAEDVAWLRSVHDRQDEDGVMSWYVPRQWARHTETLMDVTKAIDLRVKSIEQHLREGGQP